MATKITYKKKFKIKKPDILPSYRPEKFQIPNKDTTNPDNFPTYPEPSGGTFALGDKDSAIINEVQEHVRAWTEYMATNINEYRLDKQFVYITQWSEEESARLSTCGKPQLESNRLYEIVIKNAAEYREGGGELMAQSLTHDATEEEIRLSNDYLRTIYYNSGSKMAYDQAYSDMLVGGFGAYGIGTRYESVNSIHQIPFIYRLDEPDKTYYDLTATDLHRQEGAFCGRYYAMSKKAFEEAHPDIDYPQSFPATMDPIAFNWGNEKFIVICEEYRKEWYDFDLHILSDGRQVRDEEWKEIEEKNKQFDPSMFSQNAPSFGPNAIPMMPKYEKVYIERTVKKQDCKIYKYELIANKVINRQLFPGNRLPIIFCPGNEEMVDGLKRYISLTSKARDAQRLLNYIMVDIAHTIQTNRKETFLATESNISKYRSIWMNPQDHQGALVYDPDPITGQAPIHIPHREIPQSLMAMFQQAEMAIENSVGYYGANRGKDTIEKSGVALKNQQMAGALVSGVMRSNMDSAIGAGGQVLMAMRKDIFDVERSLYLLDSNKKTRIVNINQQTPDGMSNNMARGDYSVVFVAGPTQQMQKEQQTDAMIKLAELVQQPNLAADLIAEKIDASPAFVERMRSLVPPEILAKEEGRPPPPQQLNPQMMMFQAQMQNQEKEHQIEMQRLQLEFQKLQMQFRKIESDQQLASIKAQAEVRKAAMEHNKGMIDATAKIITSRHDVHKEMVKGHHSHKNQRNSYL